MGAWSFCTHTPYLHDGGDERCTRLVARGAPGERVSLSFDIACEDEPVRAAIAASRLSGVPDVNHTIDAADVDVHVVAVRDQAGIGVHRAARMAVAELLLKDDGVETRGRYSRYCGHPHHVQRARHGARYYCAPDLRLAGAAVTAVKPFERKQIWVTVRLRSDLAPGLYRGTIDVTDDAGGTGRSMSLEIEVLPIELREPRQRRMLWFRGSLDCTRAQFHVDAACFLRQLRDIRGHGFDTISIGEHSPRLLRQALMLASTAGFANLVLQPPLPPGLTRADLDGFDAVCYVSDEIDQRGTPFHASHGENMRTAERLGLPTMASFVRERFLARLPALGLGRPDLVSVYLPSNVDFFRAATAAPELRSRDTLYYWMASMEKPNVHRVLAGLYLWKSGAAGIAPYCYQHLPRAPGDPYDDFDEWEEGATAGGGDMPLKDQLATYPARTGDVPTLQWEGLGEGIADLRYIATVEHLIGKARRCEDAQIDRLRVEVETHLRAIAIAIPLAPIQIADDAEAEPYAHLDARDYEGFRRTLADDALALSRAIAEPPARRGHPFGTGSVE